MDNYYFLVARVFIELYIIYNMCLSKFVFINNIISKLNVWNIISGNNNYVSEPHQWHNSVKLFTFRWKKKWFP